MPHVCFALSCAVGCIEGEKRAGQKQLSWYSIVCVFVISSYNIPIILKSAVFLLGKLVG